MALGLGGGGEDMLCPCTSASSGSRSSRLLKADDRRWNNRRPLADLARRIGLGFDTVDEGAVGGSGGGGC